MRKKFELSTRKFKNALHQTKNFFFKWQTFLSIIRVFMFLRMQPMKIEATLKTDATDIRFHHRKSRTW